jgi:hypothetical protein
MRVTKLLLSIGVGCLVAIAIVRANSSSPQAPSPGSHFGFDWSISQEPGADKVFRCVLRVRDLDTGEVIANPTLLSKWGERAEITQAGDGRSLSASVLIDERGRQATFEAKLLREGRSIAEHHASVGL